MDIDPETGNFIINKPDPSTGNTPVVSTDNKKTARKIVIAVVILFLALAAYFFLDKQSDGTVVHSPKFVAGQVMGKSTDVLKEVPQAAKDATTDGDQDTTRPNKDDSKDKLDQK
ncbi:hypothetical protein [Acinetobacter sp.]|uniref:hypothetical protein n=1 Tax=Acinetobacter sp. TaxID=472 RepID=UPI00388EE9CC